MIKEVIQHISVTLQETFNNVYVWFDKPTKLQDYPPENGGWSITQILEHIGLTNHFLLILIEKGKRKTLKNFHNLDLSHELTSYAFGNKKLEEIGKHLAFEWIRPAHMEPTGAKTLPEVKTELQAQLKQCENALAEMPNGEGVLYKTTMTVNGLGKIDVYEYIYFLAMHAQRHIEQTEKIEEEWRKLDPEDFGSSL